MIIFEARNVFAIAKELLQEFTWPLSISDFTMAVFKSDRLGVNLNAVVVEMGRANLRTKSSG
jgi:hypothetical protein